jgi:uncharacterized protein YueI
MKREYDFSKGERGKFFSRNSKIYLPIYLDPKNLDFLKKLSKEKGIEIEDIVNEWIEKDISIVKAAK